MKKIWWDRVSSSIRFLNSITDQLRRRESFVLQLASPLPWEGYFRTNLLSQTTDARRNYEFQELDWTEQEDPGEFLMNRLCSEDFIASYWPGKARAEYLCTDPNLLFHRTIIWIHGLNTVSALNRWVHFAAEYRDASADLSQHAVLILEYTGSSDLSVSLPVTRFEVSSYDCHVFCLEACSDLNGRGWEKQYAAELALALGNGNPNICARVLKNGLSLLEHIGAAFTDEGNPYWKAQLTCFFPEIERQRMAIIQSYQQELQPLISDSRIRTADGRPVSSVWELEAGVLKFIADNLFDGKSVDFTPACRKRILLLREIRNQLAHLHEVPIDQLRELMEPIALK